MGPLWGTWAHLGTLWEFGQVWFGGRPELAPFGLSKWEHFGAPGHTWDHFGTLWDFGQVWAKPPQTGPIWSEQTGALSGDWEHFGAVMV